VWGGGDVNFDPQMQTESKWMKISLNVTQEKLCLHNHSLTLDTQGWGCSRKGGLSRATPLLQPIMSVYVVGHMSAFSWVRGKEECFSSSCVWGPSWGPRRPLGFCTQPWSITLSWALKPKKSLKIVPYLIQKEKGPSFKLRCGISIVCSSSPRKN